MPLDEYRRKRDFSKTPEPSGEAGSSDGAWATWDELPHGHRFCAQMHRATRWHIDFRLEWNGVLLSWALPQGPSLDPKDKRLAVHTEDHPIDYGDFEGVIPSGYGMGTVLLWDVGTYEWTRQSAEDPERQLAKGDIKFRVTGTKLAGEFAIVQIGGRRPGDDEKAWLMIKKQDDAVIEGFQARDINVSVRSGLSLEEIAAAHGGDPRQQRRDAKASSNAPPLIALPSYEPMLATLVTKPFQREGWIFELKYDGIRALLTLQDGRITVRGRHGRDETARYPEAQQLVHRIGAKSAVIDAEIVALDSDGAPSFEKLQQRINARVGNVPRLLEHAPATIACFDILNLDGHDLSSTALRIRKKTLHDVLREPGRAPLLYVDHVEANGEAFFNVVAERGLEGIIAKRADSTYQSGRRSRDWLKVKAWHTQSCVICGFTAGRDGRGALGALLIAVMEDGVLRNCGHVGSGLSGATIDALLKQLKTLRRDSSPLDPTPKTNEVPTWSAPELVCEVRHAGWTSGGTLRHPTFLGMRADLQPEDCVRERGTSVARLLATPAALPQKSVPRSEASVDGSTAAALEELRQLSGDTTWEIGGRAVSLTHLDKVLFPDDNITKRDFIGYYVSMAPYLLPYLRDRPLSMQVFPNGIAGKSFWRKDKPSHAPDWMDSWTYHGSKTKTYIVVNEVATLAWVANAAVIDLHPWHSRIDAPDQPDWAVFDLDPSDGATFEQVVTVARLVKAALDHYNLRGLLKTSGQTGLQIYVPIARGPSYAEVRGWVEKVGRAIGEIIPELITWDWSVARRDGKIRIDYTQNIINKTLAAAYSVRPAAGAPVSTPLEWSELEDPELRPNRWTTQTIQKRIAEHGDLFLGALVGDQKLPIGDG